MVARDAAAGAVIGFAATVPMTLAMTGMYRWLPPEEQDPLPPRQITENATARAGVHDALSEPEHVGLALGTHFAFGTAMGAAYGAMAGASTGDRQSGSAPAAVALGAAFGLGVWAANYLGVLPTAGLYRSATDESAPRNGLMLAAHLIWGASLGLGFHAARRRETGRGT